MTITALNDLIARLEQAEEGSWPLNEEIALACGWVRQKDYGSQWWQSPSDVEENVWQYLQDFTGRLVEAMRLLDPDHWWVLGKGKTRPTEPLYGVQIRAASLTEEIIIAEAEHPTSLAICVCIAALKVRKS